jgi:hypothetical protein
MSLQLVRHASAHGACQVAHVLSPAELGRHSASLFTSLVDVLDGDTSCSTTVVDLRKLAIDSPLTAHPAALELAVSLYKCARVSCTTHDVCMPCARLAPSNCPATHSGLTTMHACHTRVLDHQAQLLHGRRAGQPPPPRQ